MQEIDNHTVVFVLLFLSATITTIIILLIYFLEKKSSDEFKNIISNKYYIIFCLPYILLFIFSGLYIFFDSSSNQFKEKEYKFEFELDSYTLKQNDIKFIEKEIVHILNENKDTKVFILSYTDRTSSYEYNFKLSKKRANEVRKVLISKAIPLYRIYVSPRGMNEVLEFKNGLENTLNRRVVIKIIS